MEVLGQNHRQALISGPSNHSKTSRKLLADTIVSGDAEMLLKRCMILHHPVTSQKLRADLGTHAYYKAGYLGLVKEYSYMGIIDQNQRERLTDWVTKGQHEDTNSAEYHEILNVIANQNTD
ncbi:hypothetical protein AOLI_G00202530 [Acnodon oligacanthus]